MENVLDLPTPHLLMFPTEWTATKRAKGTVKSYRRQSDSPPGKEIVRETDEQKVWKHLDKPSYTLEGGWPAAVQCNLFVSSNIAN